MKLDHLFQDISSIDILRDSDTSIIAAAWELGYGIKIKGPRAIGYTILPVPIEKTSLVDGETCAALRFM